MLKCNILFNYGPYYGFDKLFVNEMTQENAMLIHLIAAARPNFMKIAPLYHALQTEDWAEPRIVHTGQHYDLNMSDVFFRDLGLPEPDLHLGVGSGTHAEQAGQVMMSYEKVLLEQRPGLVIVVGDVNSTMACTLAATKIAYPASPTNPPQDIGGRSSTNPPKNVRLRVTDASPRKVGGRGPIRPVVAHLEAGLRSFDRTMPEEINRLVTDALADILWTPSPDGDENLIREGVPEGKIVRVGNIMIDSLEMMRETIEKLSVFDDFGLQKGGYGLVTLHRPANVDHPEILSRLCRTLKNISKQVNLLFPVHPRTRKNLENAGLLSDLENSRGITLTEPLNYVKFMNLVFNCRLVITDSGGIQEETTYLGIPCLTLRPNTERPVTLTQGTNRLCTVENLGDYVTGILSGQDRTYAIPDLWDGHTAERVVMSIKEVFFTET